jgi:hypothetical protein
MANFTGVFLGRIEGRQKRLPTACDLREIRRQEDIEHDLALAFIPDLVVVLNGPRGYIAKSIS